MWWHVYEKGFQKVKFRLCYEDLFLKVWPNIFANRFEIDSENLEKFDAISKRWSFTSAMETSFWRSDLTFLRIDSKSILKIWRNLITCLRKGVPKGDVSHLLWRPLFEGLINISVNRFEIESESLKKIDGMFTKRCFKRWSFALAMNTSFYKHVIKFLQIFRIDCESIRRNVRSNL